MRMKIIATRLNIGESIEEKIRKASQTNTPNEAVSPLLYTDAKNGVQPEYDIRTDRQELALDAIDHYQASEIAKTDFLQIDNDKDMKDYVEPTSSET